MFVSSAFTLDRPPLTATMARLPNLRITSDDVNALIYSYLEDAGFSHTSYALRHEARLDSSPNLNVRIPRGELIKLLNKALLYSEAEAHFRRVRYLNGLFLCREEERTSDILFSVPHSFFVWHYAPTTWQPIPAHRTAATQMTNATLRSASSKPMYAVKAHTSYPHLPRWHVDDKNCSPRPGLAHQHMAMVSKNVKEVQDSKEGWRNELARRMQLSRPVSLNLGARICPVSWVAA